MAAGLVGAGVLVGLVGVGVVVGLVGAGVCGLVGVGACGLAGTGVGVGDPSAPAALLHCLRFQTRL